MFTASTKSGANAHPSESGNNRIMQSSIKNSMTFYDQVILPCKRPECGYESYMESVQKAAWTIVSAGTWVGQPGLITRICKLHSPSKLCPHTTGFEASQPSLITTGVVEVLLTLRDHVSTYRLFPLTNTSPVVGISIQTRC